LIGESFYRHAAHEAMLRAAAFLFHRKPGTLIRCAIVFRYNFFLILRPTSQYL